MFLISQQILKNRPTQIFYRVSSLWLWKKSLKPWKWEIYFPDLEKSCSSKKASKTLKKSRNLKKSTWKNHGILPVIENIGRPLFSYYVRISLVHLYNVWQYAVPGPLTLFYGLQGVFIHKGYFMSRKGFPARNDDLQSARVIVRVRQNSSVQAFQSHIH